jgi:hypothetical protein
LCLVSTEDGRKQAAYSRQFYPEGRESAAFGLEEAFPGDCGLDAGGKKKVNGGESAR